MSVYAAAVYAEPQSIFVMQQPPFPIQYGSPSVLSEVPSDLWAKNHVGLVSSATPHRVTLKANSVLRMIK